MQPNQKQLDAIYRQQVFEARRMPPEDKLFEGIRLYEVLCERMNAQVRIENPELSDAEIQVRFLQRMNRMVALDQVPILRRADLTDAERSTFGMARIPKIH